MSVTSDQIIGQLNQAKELAFSSKEMFPQVLRQIFNFSKNDDLLIQRWCAKFLRQSFTAGEDKLDTNVKTELAMDSLDSLIALSGVPDLLVFKDFVDAAIIVFKLVFHFIASNDGANQVWFKLNELKNNIINKFSTTFPLNPSDNEEHDLLRSIRAKLEILKFIIVVIDFQSRSNNNIQSFSLAQVNPNHTLIKYNVMEAESAGLVDLLLANLNQDILVPQILSATLNHLIVVAKKKPQFMSKITSTIERFDTNSKLQSNYQSIEQFKLAKKYIDRVLKNFINHILRNNLVPPNNQPTLNKKLSALIDRGNDIRKKNIFALEDSSIRKRKFEGFINPSKKLKTIDYKSLYCLTDSTDELNQFDLSSLPQNILVSMTIAALNKVKPNRLAKGLEIISERYLDALRNSASVEPEIKKEAEDEDDDLEESYEPKTIYTLPPPKNLSFQEKKKHVSLIIKNFFKLAEKKSTIPEEKDSAIGNSELTKVAIKSWKKDSWFIVLTRLATRGMRTVNDEQSPDYRNNLEMSDMIRNAIFDYFLEDIHNRVDLIIEWLNEEWYSEKVFNEELLVESLTEKYSAGADIQNVASKVEEEVSNSIIPTPVYNKWSSKVLDAMIPFLEPTDRKIFIRLLSDLPSLNEELVGKIKSLCYDPARNKIGFLSLQYLIMYRPPVKQACINVLENLAASDQEDLKEEAGKLLKKYIA
ncbi:uncharacterized protein PRCAT00001817001 [Priceomyces carsonii]|uniref:uncharacterized protein n=1 Tax=Priceomyces carsonii TaxID=28549 RepID=UPI002ED9CDF8|nr:unnamed protein product [Priceomyces carsonii]